MIRLLPGDCRSVLATLPADSVHTCVTSPPYFGLRDYGTALWDGGDAACEHTGIRRNHGDEKQASSAGTSRDPVSRSCLRCGAVRIDRQIGLEPTPEAYLQTMVEVFREVRRVLRPDGTCWVNIGDSYFSQTATQGRNESRSVVTTLTRHGDDGRSPTLDVQRADTFRRTAVGLKPKDLLMMPARLALALQADGWWVRSDIIWHKPNPMPESCTDRPTSAHEHVFLLTRSARYFYDADAVRERVGEETRRATEFRGESTPYKDHQSESNSGNVPTYAPRGEPSLAGRSCRNVWTLATHPYIHAHFATYPPALAERCIRAGTSERGCCAQCGKPWVRVTEQELHRPPAGGTTNAKGPRFNYPRVVETTTTGWQPGCAHDADIVPCRVLDPFAGAGTTLLCADRLQRDAIGIELSPDYTRMAMDRVRADAPLFADMADAPVPEPPEDARMADLFQDMAAD